MKKVSKHGTLKAGRKSCHCRRAHTIDIRGWAKFKSGGPADGPIKWYIIETLAVVFLSWRRTMVQWTRRVRLHPCLHPRGRCQWRSRCRILLSPFPPAVWETPFPESRNRILGHLALRDLWGKQRHPGQRRRQRHPGQRRRHRPV